MHIVHTDASVRDHHGAGIGWHIQTWADDQTALLEDVTKGYDYLSDNYTSMEAELLAMTRGVKEVLREGERRNIKVKSDCKPLVKKVNNHEYLTEGGQYIESLLGLLEFVEEWDVTWTRRQNNTFADRQAAVALDRHA